MASSGEVVLPSVSYSLAAIVRARKQEYVLVHEAPPRGWWLPGGGVEAGETPVDAAVRESVEEAASPSLLPLLSSPRRAHEDSLPSMTHLISLEQSPGRMRFIFRGEWTDDDDDDDEGEGAELDKPSSSVLKRAPGDQESIEARWITYADVQSLKERRTWRRGNEMPTTSLSMSDPWLRGHEPITFFGMLERSRESRTIPGLPVRTLDNTGEEQSHGCEEEATGAFFGRLPCLDQSEKTAALTYHGRAALLTHLKCRLIVYSKSEHLFAVDTETNMFPCRTVTDQNETTLKELADEMIKDVASKCDGRYQAGLLRVEHVLHDNGREATLTVFPVCHVFPLNGTDSCLSETSRWTTEYKLSDQLERELARAVIADHDRERYLHYDVLRDEEGPKRC